MDIELDYDIDKKKNLKEVKMFLSISPDKNDDVKLNNKFSCNYLNDTIQSQKPIMHFPIRNTYSQDKTRYIVENKETFLNFHKKEKETFHEILSNTFIVIAIDSDLTVYNKAIANFVKICYGYELENSEWHTVESSEYHMEENDNKIFITNYSLIKNLYEEDLRDLQVYLLPKDKDNEAYSLFKKLDYIIGFIQDKNLRKEYFKDVISKYRMRKLNINERFLKIRNNFLKTFDKNNQSEIFSDPISKDIVFPVLNIMVLNYPKQEIDANIHKDEYNVNTIDFKFYESAFIKKFQKNLVNSDITYVAYLDSDKILENNIECIKEYFINPDELFVDKSISINFGKIQKIEEMGSGYYNLMKSCSGSIIYSTKFMPLGISTIKQTNISILNTSAKCKLDSFNNSNLFIPFSNTAVICVFKTFMNVQSNYSIHIPKAKDKLFAVEKPGSICDSNKFLNQYLMISEYIDPTTNNTINSVKGNNAYFNHSNLNVKLEKEKDIKRLRNSYFLKSTSRENYAMSLDKMKLKQMNKIVKEKLINKRFNFAPFNKILEYKSNYNKSLADYIDERISNIFS